MKRERREMELQYEMNALLVMLENVKAQKRKLEEEMKIIQTEKPQNVPLSEIKTKEEAMYLFMAYDNKDIKLSSTSDDDFQSLLDFVMNITYGTKRLMDRGFLIYYKLQTTFKMQVIAFDEEDWLAKCKKLEAKDTWIKIYMKK